MAYVTLDAVKSRAPQIPIHATSKPSEGQVDEFITETEGYVDAVLTGIGYQTPVTGEIALKIVREIVVAGVLARVLNARDLGVRDPEMGGGAAMQRKFDRMLERLQATTDPLHLKDSQPTTTKRKHVRGHVFTEDADTLEPIFSITDEY